MYTPFSEESIGNDRFAIRRRLGSGGFGVVYQAYDRERNSIVALKMLSDSDPDALYRFKKEFRALADVIHPNLVVLYELFSDYNKWFFTMEMVEGVDFIEYVREIDPDQEFSYPQSSEVRRRPTINEPDRHTATFRVSEAEDQPPAPQPTGMALAKLLFDERRLRSALRQLVCAVSALHDAGKLHRDIKPSNVLVTGEDRVVALDFGLITELSLKGPQKSAEVIGTPAYMSPEHGSGNPISEPSDWYSVGVMLYESLTGRLPFDGPPLEILLAKQKFEPAAPRVLITDIPEDLNQLCQKLLRRNPADRPNGKEILRLLGETMPTAALNSTAIQSRAAISLVGREQHLAALNGAFKTSKEGKAVAAYVYGESGMGKSSLIRRFLEDLDLREQSAVVLAGRCYERESVPYKALDSLIDALSRYLAGLPKLEAEVYLPRDILALVKLFPVLRQVAAVDGARRTVLEISDSLELRRRAFAALRELLARITDKKPLVLFIEDLQWGDVDSAALIADLFQPPDPPSLLLIGSYRNEEADTSPFLKTLLPLQLKNGSSAEVMQIAVDVLSPDDAKALAKKLLAAQGMSTDQAYAIAKESGGNPFFIDELVRYVRLNKGEVREAKLEEVIRARVEQLPDEARRLLEVIAVAGQPLDKSIGREAAEIDVFDEKILSLLRSYHLIRASGADEEKLETYHDRIRETIVSSLPPNILKKRHESIALTLETSGTANPERLLAHFQGADDLEKASEYGSAAADRAYEALAFDRAARLYRTAIQLSQKLKAEGRSSSIDQKTSALQVKLADALAYAGRGSEAAKEYLVAAETAGRVEALEFQRRAAEQFLTSGHIDEGIPVIRSVLKSERLKLPKTPTQALMMLLYRRLQIKLRGLNYQERDIATIPKEELTKIDTCWSVATGLIVVDIVNATGFQTLYSILALNCGEPIRVVRAFACEAAYYAISGGRNQKLADELLQKTSALALRVNDPIAIATSLLSKETVAYFRGRWSEAIKLGKQAEELFRRHGSGLKWEMNQTQLYMLESLFFMGELKQLSDLLPSLIKESQDRSDIYFETYLRTLSLHRVLLASNRPDEADSEMLEAIEKWSHEGFHFPHWWCAVGRVAVALYSKEGVKAWKLLNEQWATFTRSPFYNIQLTFIYSTHIHAYSALAAALESSQNEALLRAAEADAKKIERENMAWSNPIARAIRAGASLVRGKQEAALDLLGKAESEFRAADMLLYAAAARRRRGDLLGGDEGGNLIREADEWMNIQKIKNPERMTDVLIPSKNKS